MHLEQSVAGQLVLSKGNFYAPYQTSTNPQ